MTQTTDRTPQEAGAVHEVDLAITGMTCASCTARIEKKLGRLEGVDAVVNLATEKARVRYAEPVTVEELLSTVRATGYGAEVVGGEAARSQRDQLVDSRTDARTSRDQLVDSGKGRADAGDHLAHRVAPEDALKRRALVSAVLTVPVVVLGMVPGIH